MTDGMNNNTKGSDNRGFEVLTGPGRHRLALPTYKAKILVEIVWWGAVGNKVVQCR